MSKKQESIRGEIYSLLKSRGFRPVSLDSAGKAVPVPEEAEIFQFDFATGDEENSKVYVTVDSLHQIVVYFDNKVASTPSAGTDGKTSWTDLLRALKRFATNRQLSFKLSNQDNLENDMAKREHVKHQEQVNEGYYAMGRKASYNDSVPTVTMRIQHSRPLEEGEQRFRHIEKIFVENQQGERFLLPTNKPGLGRVYARHIAEGGKPNDTRWDHITGLCEEYQKMAGFVRATRNNQFNESAQRLVNEGINHFHKLRESLGKLAGKRGYNAYFESWTPSLMEDEEQVDLSEMFMQSSLDPRIESVMPILGKLNKHLGEAQDMHETIALNDWAESITSLESQYNDEEADYGEEYQDMVARVGQKAKEQEKKKPVDIQDLAKRLKQVKLKDEEVEEGVLDTAKKVGQKVLSKLGHGSDEELLKDLQKKSGVPSHAQHGKPPMAKSNEAVEEEKTSQAYRDAMAAHDSAGREYRLGQAKDRMAQRAAEPKTLGQKIKKDIGEPLMKLAKGDVKGALGEELGSEQKRVGQLGPKADFARPGDLVGANESVDHDDLARIKQLMGK